MFSFSDSLGEYNVYDVFMKELLWMTTVDETPSCMRFVHDSVPGRRRVGEKGLLVFGYYNGVITIEMPTHRNTPGYERLIRTEHHRVVCCDVVVAYSILASVGSNRSFELWDLKYGVCLTRMELPFPPAHIYILRKRKNKFHVVISSPLHQVVKLEWPVDEGQTELTKQKVSSLNPNHSLKSVQSMNLTHCGNILEISLFSYPFTEYSSGFSNGYWRVNRSSGSMGSALSCDNNKEHFVVALNAYDMKEFSRVKINPKVLALQAIGRRFAVLLAMSSTFGKDDILLVDLKQKVTAVSVSIDKLPR